jgi:hypothetical protein
MVRTLFFHYFFSLSKIYFSHNFTLTLFFFCFKLTFTTKNKINKKKIIIRKEKKKTTTIENKNKVIRKVNKILFFSNILINLLLILMARICSEFYDDLIRIN